MSQRFGGYNDLQFAASGSGYGHSGHSSCYCPKKEKSSSNLGLLAAAAIAFFLLYQAILMLKAKRRRKRNENDIFETIGDLTIPEVVLKGRKCVSSFYKVEDRCHIITKQQGGQLI